MVVGNGRRALCSQATAYYTPGSAVGGEWRCPGTAAGRPGSFVKVKARCESPRTQAQRSVVQTCAPRRWASYGAACTASPRRHSCARARAPTRRTCWRRRSSLHSEHIRLRCGRSSCCNDTRGSSPRQRSPRTRGSSNLGSGGWCCCPGVGSGWART